MPNRLNEYESLIIELKSLYMSFVSGSKEYINKASYYFKEIAQYCKDNWK